MLVEVVIAALVRPEVDALAPVLLHLLVEAVHQQLAPAQTPEGRTHEKEAHIGIVEAARQVLVREGSNGFSLRKVAAEAGLSLSNVQYYYPTRVTVMEGILAGFIEEYQDYLSGQLHPAEGGRETLTAFIQEILVDESRNEEIRFFRSLFTFAYQDSLAGQLDAFYSEVYRLLCPGLGRLSSRVADSPPVHRAASLLLPYLNGYGMVCSSLGLGLEESARDLSGCAWALLNQNGQD